MAIQNHVAGPVKITVGTGASYALQDLGYSVDGVSYNLQTSTDDVITDVYGSKVPYDVQHFLMGATVDVTLVLFDATVAATVESVYFGGAQGVMPAAGSLLVAQGLTFPLILKSTPSGTGVYGTNPCMKFPNAFVTSYKKHQGTKKTTIDVSFRCLLSQIGSASTGAVLFSLSCT